MDDDQFGGCGTERQQHRRDWHRYAEQAGDIVDSLDISAASGLEQGTTINNRPGACEAVL